MFIASLLKRIWQKAAQTGLLDEQDIALLDEEFAEELDGNKLFIISALEIMAFLIPSLALSLYFGFYCAIASFTFSILLANFTGFLFSTMVCYLWNSCVDERFRQFMSMLRQRELCLFSLQNRSQNFLHSQKSRRKCLQQLRGFVSSFNHASHQLVPNLETEKLFSNFIGEEMRALATDDGNLPDEEFLQISALKNLWQYMFLVRSEFLRISLLSLQRDLNNCQPVEFIRHFAIFIRTIWRTCWLSVGTDNCNRKFYGNYTNCWKNRGKPPPNIVTPLEVCKAQLEWALERLNSLDSDDQNDRNNQSTSDIVICLEHVIRTLKGSGIEEESTTDEGKAKLELPKRIEVETTKEGPSNEMDKENVDYQIFELDLTKANALTQQTDGIVWTDQMDSLLSPYGAHGAVMHELKQALCQRKDFCLQRELQALARLRGVATEEIAAEELDRVPFSSDIAEQKPDHKPPPKPPLNRGPFGLAKLDTADLNSILAQRQTLFGNGTGTNGNVMAVEEFGEESGDEMDEK